jgi:hypothetical protein
VEDRVYIAGDVKADGMTAYEAYNSVTVCQPIEFSRGAAGYEVFSAQVNRITGLKLLGYLAASISGRLLGFLGSSEGSSGEIRGGA